MPTQPLHRLAPNTTGALKWAIPVALVATPAYLFAMDACSTTVARGAPGSLNVLVVLFGWNTLKFTALGIVSRFALLARRLKRGQ